jgi:hypothetical protein
VEVRKSPARSLRRIPHLSGMSTESAKCEGRRGKIPPGGEFLSQGRPPGMSCEPGNLSGVNALRISTGPIRLWSVTCPGCCTAQEGKLKPRGKQMATKRRKPRKKGKKLRAGKLQRKVSTLVARQRFLTSLSGPIDG